MAEYDNKRNTKRWPTRLRAGKVFDRSNRFLAECWISDRSESGARLRLESVRPLPVEIRIYDEAFATLSPAAVVWMREGELGIRFLRPEEDPIRLSPEEIAQLNRVSPRRG